jgi:hypothetical protein
MTVAAKNQNLHDSTGVASAGVEREPRSFVAQLFAYLFEWRRREARRTIGRYDHLVARHHRFAASEAEAARRGAAPAADHVDVIRSVAILRDFA